MDRRATRLLLVLAASLTLVVGCGGSDDTATTRSSDEGRTTAQTTTTAGGEATGIENQTFDVGQDFWHSGFHISADSGEISSKKDDFSDEVTYFLTLGLTLENTGTTAGFIDTEMTIVTADNSYPASPLNDLGEVAAGTTAQGELTFLIDGGFDLPSAVLMVGGPDVNQARVPLAGGTEPVRLEPRSVDVAGTMSMELVDLTFKTAELRYDDPVGHREVDAGKQALILDFDVVSRKGGNWQIFATDFGLTLPDGTVIAPDRADIGSLPGSDEGVTTADRQLQFIVDGSPAGDYTLRLTPGTWFIGEDGVTDASFAFTIDG
ncbi:MAG: hypothetical protein WBV06_11115 [Acidimicrobiia bacterium]